jgi:hypothetical protein
VRYWWVNQNQTYRQEQDGGYLWSPKRNANGAKNPFYESMREVSPGDVVFAYADTYVASVGTATSYCFECPKPKEFGKTGEYWENIGWKVLVNFRELDHPVRPRDHMSVIGPLLPSQYSPLRSTGDGYQRYLVPLSKELGEVLVGLIGADARNIVDAVAIGEPMQTNDDLDWWEHHIEAGIETDTTVPPTEREAIIRARQGQGIFKQRVMTIEQRCRITGVTNPVHLIASHCKPWRDSNNEERLNGENGLLLTPTIDHLFDRGFIGFEGNGNLIISPVAHKPSLERMGIETKRVVNVGSFTEGQRHFLEFHRIAVLLQSAR